MHALTHRIDFGMAGKLLTSAAQKGLLIFWLGAVHLNDTITSMIGSCDCGKKESSRGHKVDSSATFDKEKDCKLSIPSMTLIASWARDIHRGGTYPSTRPLVLPSSEATISLFAGDVSGTSITITPSKLTALSLFSSFFPLSFHCS